MKIYIPLLVSALLLMPQFAKAQGNLVINDGFDNNASGWTTTYVSGSGYLSSGGNPGGCFGLINIIYPFQAPTISQEISGLIPGQVYVVSGDYKFGGKSFVADSFVVALDGNVLFLTNSPPDAVWHSFSFEYVATSTNALLSLSGQLNGTGYTYYIDNIAMQKTPAVAIQISETNVVVSWPTNALGFALQSSTSINIGSWTAITNAPIVVGTNYTVTLNATNPVQCFSLKR
jgi:hypothetical protein